ncbi:17-beta-hydroxysteroid dehydrogenase 13-like [Dendronephthya gigantea]|uniref:17-beta-hydroxysteroid dehydrogenase 13-like n=1 Tax=Dendronephthya gigantea TaxID=151771 RepID=UPI00106C7388|nr:17-beta-hydroxysteroid dehydrogenase 13-like [Dendronephthya gigantea]
MGLAFEIFELLLRIFWTYLESAYRLIIPVPRKKINGEIVLITGGGGKIGECIASELIKEDVTIVLWDVSEKAMDRVAGNLRKQGGKVHTYRCDLTSKDEVYSVAKTVEEEVGHVTILINNAGIMITRNLLKCSDDELAKQMQVNTVSHFWTCKAFLPHMLEINHGHIVTVASVAGLFGLHNVVGYCTSKFAAVGFHKALSLELLANGKTGVKTSCLCPYMVRTPLLGKSSARFPSMFPLLEPEYVAKEMVDGMLRDKFMIVLPRSLSAHLLSQMLMPVNAMKLLFHFFRISIEEETAATMFQRREQAAAAEEKKSG